MARWRWRAALLLGFLSLAAVSMLVGRRAALPVMASATSQEMGQSCATPALDFREQQRDEQDRLVFDAVGEPVWIAAEAIGSDGRPHHLTSAYVLPNAEVGEDVTGRPEVRITFTEEGTSLMAQITARNVGRPLAIFLDGALLVSPIVTTPITDGRAVISAVEEAPAHTLVDRLNTEAARAVNGCIPANQPAGE